MIASTLRTRCLCGLPSVRAAIILSYITTTGNLVSPVLSPKTTTVAALSLPTDFSCLPGHQLQMEGSLTT